MRVPDRGRRRALAVLRSFVGSIKVSVDEVSVGLDIEPERGDAVKALQEPAQAAESGRALHVLDGTAAVAGEAGLSAAGYGDRCSRTSRSLVPSMHDLDAFRRQG